MIKLTGTNVLLCSSILLMMPFWIPGNDARGGFIQGPPLKDQIRNSYVHYIESFFDIVESVLKDDEDLKQRLPIFYTIKNKILSYVNQTSNDSIAAFIRSLQSFVGVVRNYWDAVALPLLERKYDPVQVKKQVDTYLETIEQYLSLNALGEPPEDKGQE